jgi:CDP-diacylglycerol--glycerol-3-phosphate 3-phosphatidyltransferase
MTWTIPNILTTLRLLAAPGIAVMFLYFHRPWADWFALVLFLSAALTDYFDGYLARLWKQESKFGAMMDPIADKAMVVIALLVITGFSGMNPWLLLPSTVIMFREVVIPGLREFLGETSKLLAVTKLAKWKTTAQMVSIAVLFASGVGTAEDPLGLHLKPAGIDLLFTAGTILLWIAAVLTLVTGWDYFVKAMPYLRDEKRR